MGTQAPKTIELRPRKQCTKLRVIVWLRYFHLLVGHPATSVLHVVHLQRAAPLVCRNLQQVRDLQCTRYAFRPIAHVLNFCAPAMEMMAVCSCGGVCCRGSLHSCIKERAGTSESQRQRITIETGLAMLSDVMMLHVFYPGLVVRDWLVVLASVARPRSGHLYLPDAGSWPMPVFRKICSLKCNP